MKRQIGIIGVGIALLTMCMTSCNYKRPEKEGELKSMTSVTKSKECLAYEDSLRKAEAQANAQAKIWTDMAQLLAGLDIDSTNTYYAISKTKDWEEYQKKCKHLWYRFEDNEMNVRGWRAENLDSTLSDKTQLFYPFSGADFGYANALFPNMKEYFLLALEPVGSIPEDIDKMDTAQLKRFSSGLYNSVADILGFSFFITKNMSRDMRNERVDGTLPVLMMFLGRTGKHISNIQTGIVTATGNIDTVPKGQKANIVRFTLGDDDDKQVVNYISCDLANYKLKQDSVLVSYLSRHVKKGCCSYFKAASYLMHSPNFTNMKNFVLIKSSFILEDDSGIPYKDLLSNGFNCHLYGEYTKPINLFSNKFQPDLLEAYKAANSVKLPFRIGYGYKYNLIAASK